jgi:hypothetical protein
MPNVSHRPHRTTMPYPFALVGRACIATYPFALVGRACIATYRCDTAFSFWLSQLCLTTDGYSIRARLRSGRNRGSRSELSKPACLVDKIRRMEPSGSTVERRFRPFGPESPV